MYYRYSILLCLLLIAVGCDQFSNVPDSGQSVSPPTQPIPPASTPAPSTPAPAPPTPAPKISAVEQRYEQSLRDRLEIQEKIFKAMDLYRESSLKVYQQETQLKNLLKGKSIGETIDLFSKSNIGEIPSDLRSAYSLWRGLMPDEKQVVQIDKWIEKQMNSGILEDLDSEIKEFENRRELGAFLDEDELAKFDEMRARTRLILNENFFTSSGLSLDEEVIKNQKDRWADWE